MIVILVIGIVIEGLEGSFEVRVSSPLIGPSAVAVTPT
jgi:hypothetical protein